MSGIKAGFTGELEDRTRAAAVARRAADTVQREAGAVVAVAEDHRTATGSVLLLVGAIAFFAGYLAGAHRTQQASPPARLRRFLND